jgi:hypothetical protein
MKQNLPTQFDQADMTNIPRALHHPAVNRPVHPTHKLENSLWSFLELPGQSDESFRSVVAVSLSANSQNTVQPADFSANDPFHVALERLANDTWMDDGKGRWFYERARGSYEAAAVKASFTDVQKARFASVGSQRPTWQNT